MMEDESVVIVVNSHRFVVNLAVDSENAEHGSWSISSERAANL